MVGIFIQTQRTDATGIGHVVAAAQHIPSCLSLNLCCMYSSSVFGDFEERTFPPDCLLELLHQRIHIWLHSRSREHF